MRGQPAKVLSKTDIRTTIAAATRLRYPDRNRVMVLLERARWPARLRDRRPHLGHGA